MLGDFGTSGELLAGRPDADNDLAASAWLSGANTASRDAWEAMPDSPAVLFNRGMSRLFTGRIAEAREPLQKAVEQIPEASGWHALARLYLAVAEIHG
jgi:Flp pilus assembly protein TadD